MFLQLLSNASLAKRFFQYAMLIPLVMRFIEKAEATEEDGETKRQTVVDAIGHTVHQLVKSGFVPAETQDREELDKISGELVDTAVKIYNQFGFFRKERVETDTAGEEGK